MSLDGWLTIDELTGYLKLGRTKLYQLTQQGMIPASKVGKGWRFEKAEVDAWLRRQSPGITAEQTNQTRRMEMYKDSVLKKGSPKHVRQKEWRKLRFHIRPQRL